MPLSFAITFSRNCHRTVRKLLITPRHAPTLWGTMQIVSATTSRRRRQLTTKQSGGDSAEQHNLFKEQMRQLQEEREELFGFTEQEQEAWGGAGKNHRHDASFLETISNARTHASSESDTDSVQHSAEKDECPVASPPILSHVSADGSSVEMVDVGPKTVSLRRAVAEARVIFPLVVSQTLQSGEASERAELVGPKGPIFATAKLAGIMAAKKTSDLIPLCHPLPLEKVDVDIRMPDERTVIVRCECRVTHKTGVEMEALTGASVAALCIYDMVKALSHEVRIEGTHLVHKSGGRRNIEFDGEENL